MRDKNGEVTMANEVRLIDADALMEQFEIEYHHADAMGNKHRKKGVSRSNTAVVRCTHHRAGKPETEGAVA